MKLNDITNYIQKICDNIYNVLEVDVTVVTRDLDRIAGTGIFRENIGQAIAEKTIYNNVLNNGEPYFIDKKTNKSCNKCSKKNDCKELLGICTPIKLNEEILGVLGIAAFNEAQKNSMLSKNEDLKLLIDSMSDLISLKLYELYKEEIKTIDELEEQAIKNAIKKYGNSTENMKLVAKSLNIGIATLYRKVKKFNIKY